MKKKTIRLLILLVLMAALAACAASKPAEAPEPEGIPEPEPAAASAVSIDLRNAGVSFDLPAQMQALKGTVQQNYGVEIGQDSGIYLSGLTYCAMTEERYNELLSKAGNFSEEDVAFASPRMIDFLVVYTVDGGRTLEDVLPELKSYNLPTEGCRELGTVGEYRFFSLVNPLADLLDSRFQFDEGFREDYDALLALCDDTSWIRIYEPETASTAGEGTAVSFETADLAGNPVSSEAIFRENTLTMLNLWGTFCGPCINEMPDLEVLNGRLKEKNCAIIGVVIDVRDANDSGTIRSAEEIIAETGVTYQNLLPWQGLDSVLPAEFVPTTYFIDSEGRVVGEAAVGARGADEYEALIDELLQNLS